MITVDNFLSDSHWYTNQENGEQFVSVETFIALILLARDIEKEMEGLSLELDSLKEWQSDITDASLMRDEARMIRKSVQDDRRTFEDEVQRQVQIRTSNLKDLYKKQAIQDFMKWRAEYLLDPKKHEAAA